MEPSQARLTTTSWLRALGAASILGGAIGLVVVGALFGWRALDEEAPRSAATAPASVSDGRAVEEWRATPEQRARYAETRGAIERARDERVRREPPRTAAGAPATAREPSVPRSDEDGLPGWVPPVARSGARPRDGRLHAQAVVAAVGRVLPLVRQCYAAALRDSPGLAGRLDVEFEFAGEPAVGGIVHHSTVLPTSTLVDPTVHACVAELMYRLELPPPEHGGVTVIRYPLVFASGPPDAAR